MEREIDFKREYEKIETMVLVCPQGGYQSINDIIANHFLQWKFKGNYGSFQELRRQMGFNYTKHRYTIEYSRHELNADDFILYCEMMLNMFFGVMLPYSSGNFRYQGIENIIEIMK